jgi:hypothetical protein
MDITDWILKPIRLLRFIKRSGIETRSIKEVLDPEVCASHPRTTVLPIVSASTELQQLIYCGLVPGLSRYGCTETGAARLFQKAQKRTDHCKTLS